VNEGPIDSPSEETPAAPETPAPETPETPAAPAAPPASAAPLGPAAWEVVPQPAAEAEASELTAPSPYTPAPDYPGAPPAYAGEPMAAAPGRSNRPIIIVAGVIVLIVVLVIGYAGAGYVFANGRIDTAKNTYNTVVSHQNALTDEFNSFDAKVTPVNVTSATTADLKKNQAAYAQLVSQSQSAEPTISTDDSALASAQASLGDNSWLTVFSRSNLDHVSAKIGHERKALAAAKTITADIVQLGNFYQAFYSALIDLDTLSTNAQNTDFAAAKASVAILTSDLSKALQMAGAPGLPPEMKALLTDFQTFAADFGKLLDAAIAGDSTGATNALKAVEADAAKIDAYNFDKMASDTKAFYQPLIDSFNAEVSAANSM
jgi:hypothetical protein